MCETNEREHACGCGCKNCHAEEHMHMHESGCSCCEHEEENRTAIMMRISASAVLLLGAILLEKFTAVSWIVTTIIYVAAFLVVGYEVIWTVVKNFVHFDIHDIFDEEFLMLIASVGAFCLGECAEAVIIMLFWQIGEFFQDVAVDKSRDSIEKLMDIRPEFATKVESDGSVRKLIPEQVHTGDLIIVKAGEKIPLDGVVEKGTCLLDTSALTGESVPRRASEGDEVMSGCMNMDGVLYIRTTGEYENSAVSRILALIETEDKAKSKSEKFINRFARIYTPIVVGAAVLLAILPPVITGTFAFAEWVHRALMFLVVSCPCALVISVPLAFFGGIGKASANGILVKGSACMDKLSRMNIVALDKTGTLTHGKFTVTDLHTEEGISRDHLLRIAKSAEQSSNHPIASAIVKACEQEGYPVSDYEERAGMGIVAKLVTDDGEVTVCLGNAKLMQSCGITCVDEKKSTCTYVAENGKLIGSITVEDALKAETPEAVSKLRECGCRVYMLTGDAETTAKHVAEKLGIEYKAELLPGDKVTAVRELMRDGICAFAGDGINDTPVISAADCGFAMGGLGSDAAIEAADAVIMDDDLRKIAQAKRISQKTLRIAKENIAFALAVKLLVLGLGAFGIANMYLAVFADVGVSLLAVLNSIRAMR